MLTQSELTLLNNHRLNHFIAKQLTDSNLLLNFYTEIPVNTLSDLIYLLTPSDRKHFFAFTDFPDWYSQFNQKIETSTTIPIFGLSNEQINTMALQLLSSLVEANLTEHSMQQLIQHMIKRDLTVPLNQLLTCFGADGKFTETTLWLLNIDLQLIPRWQSLGLPSSPTLLDIENILTTPQPI